MTGRSTQAVAIPVLASIAIVVSIPSILLQWKNRNFPTTSLICWFLVLNLFNFINALLWPTDDIESWWDGRGLCDVEVKIMIASYVAVPGALACIFRSLASVLDTRRAMLVPSKSQRWRNRIVESLFCVVIPIIAMITHIVYQKTRYMLFGISGCVNNFDEGWVSLALSFVWPPIICLLAAFYCGLTLYRLHKYRSQFGEIFNSASGHLNKSRFLRLFFLAFVMLLTILPMQAFVLYQNILFSLPWHPYSWSALHGPEWNTIIKVPSNGQAFFDRWIPIAACYVLFIFFGCCRDAFRLYGSILCFLGLGGRFDALRPSPHATISHGRASTSSRARLLFSKKWPSERRTFDDSAPSRLTSQNYADVEKGTVSLQNSQDWKKSLWTATHSTFFGSRLPSLCENAPSSPKLSVPATTISTNAWAGTSQSRGSGDFSNTPVKSDSIRVKQVISQESETKTGDSIGAKISL